MQPLAPLLVPERSNYEFFLALPEPDRAKGKLDNKGTQLLQPLFEYSGACAGCGETPYIKLLTQILGDRLIVANATGCSSIFGGNLPTTPYCTNSDGRGPAWSNSLFEDNAEFGLGLRLSVDALQSEARALVASLSKALGAELCDALLAYDPSTDAGIEPQRERVARLREKLRELPVPSARRLEAIADYLVHKSVWTIGGDGWAYDIGFGGLDHVLSLRRNVKVLVLDTEVYSNTGGQQSKSTPRGASAKFAAAGKSQGKKDLALMAMTYGHVYVARIALGAKDNQAVKVLREAEAYDGPALVIAYAHCIAHGFDLAHGAEQQKLAVASGAWPLYRYDPRRAAAGEPGLVLDSGEPSKPLAEFREHESRFRAIQREDPQRYEALLAESEREIRQRWALLELLAGARRAPESVRAEAGT
jgi:pyruvate-ferredoxin/flavodoxin oxidoreductase